MTDLLLKRLVAAHPERCGGLAGQRDIPASGRYLTNKENQGRLWASQPEYAGQHGEKIHA
jgi:hypothetical protein